MSRKKIKSKKKPKTVLTDIEKQVLHCIYQNNSVEDICETLDMEVLEVLDILSNIYSKFPEHAINGGT